MRNALKAGERIFFKYPMTSKEANRKRSEKKAKNNSRAFAFARTQGQNGGVKFNCE